MSTLSPASATSGTHRAFQLLSQVIEYGHSWKMCRARAPETRKVGPYEL